MAQVHLYQFLLDHRIGGPHRFVQTLCQGLAQAGDYDFTLVTTAQGELTQMALINLRHKRFLYYPLEVLLNVGLLILWRWRGKLAKKALFHVHGSANLAPVLAAIALRIPVIWHIHEVVPAFKPLVALAKLFLPLVPHRFVAVTPQSLPVYSLPANTAVILNPVDPDYWKPTGPDQRGQDFVILQVANVNPLKNQDFFLQVLADLPGAWSYGLIGQFLETHPEYGEGIKKQAEEIMANNPLAKIEFYGKQEMAQVREKLEACHLFVLPSKSEACPISLLEALCLGRNALASQVGSVAELLGPVGKALPVGDHQAWLEALTWAKNLNPAQRQAQEQAARQRMIEHFSLSQTAAQMHQIIQELVS